MSVVPHNVRSHVAAVGGNWDRVQRWVVRRVEENQAGSVHDAGTDPQPSNEAPAVEFLAPSWREPQLFDYQAELSVGCMELLNSQESRGMVALPTGGGKTRVAAYSVLAAIHRHQIQSVLWLAPTAELLSQARDTFVALWREMGSATQIALRDWKRCAGASAPSVPHVDFGTPQLLARRTDPSSGSDHSLIVFDEAHHAVAATYWDALERTMSRSNAKLLGLSATPGRRVDSETEALVKFFKTNLIVSQRLGRRPLDALVERGVLARLHFHKMSEETLAHRRVRAALQNRTSLEANTSRTQALMEVLVGTSGEGRQAIVFCASVVHAISVAAALRSRGTEADVVSGYMPPSRRRAVIKAFREGKLKVLVNRHLLTAGFDCPSIRDVFILCPIRSPIQFEQMVGRAARGPAVGGGTEGHVWEFDDNLLANGLPSSYYRFRDFDWY